MGGNENDKRKNENVYFLMNMIKNQNHGIVCDVQVFLTYKFSTYNDKFEKKTI